MFYEKIVRPILFKYTDPETIHHRVIGALDKISRQKTIYNALKSVCVVNDPRLAVRLGNVSLPNPVGLAAGFDKNIEAPLAYPMLGFGWAELGSVTSSAQAGNPKPRLWRLPKDKGLIVYYGLSNQGIEECVRKLNNLTERPIPYGVSIAPSNGLDLDEMTEDYVKSFLKVYPSADYITLNVSCPNVASCAVFSQLSFIRQLVNRVGKEKKENGVEKDIFIKIGPGMDGPHLRELVEICIENKLTGIIATNLIKNRTTVSLNSAGAELAHPGGISGKKLSDLSTASVRELYRYAQGRLKIIGVGGIFTAEDAYEKIKAGASAVQMITGFIYGGPLVVKQINDGLSNLLSKDGFRSISEAVGVES